MQYCKINSQTETSVSRSEWSTSNHECQALNPLKMNAYLALKVFIQIEKHLQQIDSLLNDLYQIDEGYPDTKAFDSLVLLDMWTKESLGLIRSGYDPILDKSLSYLNHCQS